MGGGRQVGSVQPACIADGAQHASTRGSEAHWRQSSPEMDVEEEEGCAESRRSIWSHGTPSPAAAFVPALPKLVCVPATGDRHSSASQHHARCDFAADPDPPPFPSVPAAQSIHSSTLFHAAGKGETRFETACEKGLAKVEDAGREEGFVGGQQAKVGGGGQAGQACRQSVQSSAPAGTAEVEAMGA